MVDKKKRPMPLWVKIIFILGVLLVIGIIATNNNGENNQTSIHEAQTKCMLMEESDLVNYMGEPFGNNTTKKAEEFCLSLWDKSQNPDNSEEEFVRIVEMDWAERKTEILEGYTLEQLYTESIK